MDGWMGGGFFESDWMDASLRGREERFSMGNTFRI